MTRTFCAAVLFLIVLTPQRAAAYSVMSHEALIDATWETELAPLLRRRFPSASADALRAARAYAYGGSLIQDLGYYPFGSTLFSNLVHYVRSGDFVDALLREAQDLNEYAFALGALAHYACDNAGHPIAVNRVVPMMYPKVRAEHGDRVLYAHAKSRHVMVEFAFDVLQVARGSFKSDVYQAAIGFEVATGVLDRAFQHTYGLTLKEVFGDVDLAVGTYRRAVSQIIPDMTRLAWREKKEEILKATPGLTERDVVFTMSRAEYEKSYGTKYRKPGVIARIIVTLSKVIPKFGPFKPLAFEPLTPEADRLFRDSFSASQKRYRELLVKGAAIADTDLDTGVRPERGVNPLADETFEDLVGKLAKKKFAGVPPALRASVNSYYASGGATSKKLARRLAELNAAR